MYRNIKIVLQYDGSRYDGWQKQGNTKNTIQGKLEAVLEKLAGESVEVYGSGRTDAGVHAMGQTANFRLEERCLEELVDKTPEKKENGGTEERRKPEKGKEADIPAAVMDYLNRYLPEDIAVISAAEVPERFHSRLNAVEKTYLYQIETASRKNVFERKYIWGLGKELDLPAMEKAAEILLGSHDFRAFSSAKRMKKSAVRELRKVEIYRKGSRVSLEFTGNGFLYNMVRILAGTLIEVGLHKRTIASVREALESRDRERAGFTAPAEGLLLKSVRYDEKSLKLMQ